MPADGLAPNSARPSAGRVMTTNLDMFLISFIVLTNSSAASGGYHDI